MLLSRQDRRDAAEGTGLVLIGAIALVIVAFIVSALVWWLNTSTSGIKGRGDVIRQNNDASNRIAAQAEFDKLWGDIQGYQANIVSASALLKQNPADTYQQSVLTAEQQICRSTVQAYNADTVNTTMRDWRPSADPASINQATECETPR